MDNKISGDQEETNNSGPGHSVRSTGGNLESSNTHSQNGAANQQNSDGVDHQFNLVRWTRSLTIFTAVLALASIGSLVVAIYQLRAANGQLDAMQQQLKSMDDSSRQVERSIQQFTRQADAATDANAISKQALALLDRPWMGVSLQAPSPTIGQGLNIGVIVSNLGRSPAMNEYGQSEWGIVTDYSQLNPINACLECARQTFFPTATANSYISIPKDNFTFENMNKIFRGELTLFIREQLFYEDINKSMHKTTFCAYFDYVTKMYSSCKQSKSNDAS